MTEHDDARVELARDLDELARDVLADTAQMFDAGGVDVGAVLAHAGVRALGHDDDGEQAAQQLLAASQPLRDVLDRERNLGQQNHVGAAGDARVQRQMAGVAAHDLDHHDAVVARGREAQLHQRLGHRVDRRIEAHRPLCLTQHARSHSSMPVYE